jgi:hypothetical protein
MSLCPFIFFSSLLAIRITLDSIWDRILLIALQYHNAQLDIIVLSALVPIRVHCRLDSMHWGSVRHKASAYTQDNTNIE